MKKLICLLILELSNFYKYLTKHSLQKGAEHINYFIFKCIVYFNFMYCYVCIKYVEHVNSLL